MFEQIRDKCLEVFDKDSLTIIDDENGKEVTMFKTLSEYMQFLSNPDESDWSFEAVYGNDEVTYRETGDDKAIALMEALEAITKFKPAS